MSDGISFVFPAAADSFVLTPDGPVGVDDLHAGEPLVVLRKGDLSTSTLREIEAPQEPVSCIRLLTSVGDIVVDQSVVLLTKGGPLRASDVASIVADGRTARLELVRPSASTRGSRLVVVDALRRLVAPPRALHFPSSISDTPLKELARAFKALGSPLVQHDEDRWVVLEGNESTNAPAADLDARLLLQALAWSDHGSSPESRVILDDHGIRRALLLALVRDGLPFSVRWVPSYRPVEARVALLEPPSWPAFVSVVGAVPSDQLIFRLAIRGDRAAVVTGLALAMPPLG